jgi:hypothetical protein
MQHQFTPTTNGIAWGAIKANRAANWKAAMKIAANCMNIVDMLNEGEVSFAFTNNEGQVREARGTRNSAILETIGIKPLAEIDRTAKSVVYWDFDAIDKKSGLPGSFRSFVPARMVQA